jgi:hypothetical protein
VQSEANFPEGGRRGAAGMTPVTRRATPKPVRRAARAAGITVRELAMAVHADQPSSASWEHEALECGAGRSNRG